jgi:hypothetical protein
MNFGVLIAGGMVVAFVAVLALGYFYPGNGSDVLDWRPTRSVEVEAELELDDIAQMLEAQNERRRRRGARERTLEEVELQVAGDLAEQRRRRDAHLAGREPDAAEQADLDDLLAAANERRRRRGEPPVSAEHYRPDAG